MNKDENMDPDYKSYNAALELSEEEEKKENTLKLTKIIEEEFNNEIVRHQDQIEHIEQQIFKVRKVLHLLRYVLIMSFYKKKELEYHEDEASTSNDGSQIEIDKQNRIHPALKKLLGSNIHSLHQIQVKDKRKSASRLNLLQEKKVPPTSESPPKKKLKFTEQRTFPAIEPQHSSVRNRKKTEHRLIVGNTSQSITTSAAENFTHKWLVYVRGPKDQPNISYIVDKVVFYLHPSYKPYDVVEICETPFHLARRGWGEFPIRVQIFFKAKMNKPIDVVHNIVLDKSYTGKQTLGKETIVQVFLYDAKCPPNFKHEEVEIKEEIKEELIDDVVIEEEPIDDSDYSFPRHSLQISGEHSYCLDDESMVKPSPAPVVVQDEKNPLIFGLNMAYLEQQQKSLHHAAMVGQTATAKNKIVRQVYQMLQTSYMLEQQQRVTLPSNRFKSMGEALMYTFRHLPMCSARANNTLYRKIYPFTAADLEEFNSWNVGKRRSAEWSRALEIKKMVRPVPGSEKWSLKAIVMFGRAHEFMPGISYASFEKNTQEKQLLLSCYANPLNILEPYRIAADNDEDNLPINVDSVGEALPKKKTFLIDIKDERIEDQCKFIQDAVLENGIILRDEEIESGAVFNGAERMILEAVKCFAEDLVRRAQSHVVCSYYPNSSWIKKEHVEKALKDRPDFGAVERHAKLRKRLNLFS